MTTTTLFSAFSSLFLLVLLLLSANGQAQTTPTTTPPTEIAVSEQCQKESHKLQEDKFLTMVQTDLYQAYEASFDELCDFSEMSITEGHFMPECGLGFKASNKTYLAACEDKGGIILSRPVILKCGLEEIATYNVDLSEYSGSYIPTCVGKSCNTTALNPHQLHDPRVEDFLFQISLTGVCEADFPDPTSSSSYSYSYSYFLYTGGSAMILFFLSSLLMV